MLDQLIESRNHAEENAKRGGFLLATFFLVATMLSSGILWSLFAKDLGIGNDTLELSTMITPIPPSDNEPPEPKRQQDKREQLQTTKNTTRQSNMARIDEVQPAPTQISVTPNTQKSRPAGPFKIDMGIEIDFAGSPTGNSLRGNDNVGTGLQNSSSAQPEIVEKVAPPPALVIKKQPEEAAKKSKPPMSGGVVNGRATSLPKPVYSAAAIAINARGDVNVQVLIDEKGNVISAKALGGHPLLRDSAERAARNAKFSPTILTGQPVKVTGIIVYKFSKN
jgi:protein TonB